MPGTEESSRSFASRRSHSLLDLVGRYLLLPSNNYLQGCKSEIAPFEKCEAGLGVVNLSHSGFMPTWRGLDIYRFEQTQKLTPTCLAGLDIPVRAVPEANAYLLGGVGHTGSSGPRSSRLLGGVGHTGSSSSG
jgi:hypothetical protein